MTSTLLLMIGGVAVAAGLYLRQRDDADARLATALLALGLGLLAVSIVWSGVQIGRAL